MLSCAFHACSPASLAACQSRNSFAPPVTAHSCLDHRSRRLLTVASPHVPCNPARSRGSTSPALGRSRRSRSGPSIGALRPRGSAGSAGARWSASTSTSKPASIPSRSTRRSRTAVEADHVQTLAVEPKEFPTRELRVAPKFVNPPPSVQHRIDRERRQLGALFRAVAPEPRWTGSFLRPIEVSVVSGFGVRSVYNGEPRAPHTGADFASPSGTPVRGARRRARGAGRAAVLHGTHRDDRPRRGAGVAARAPVVDRRARGGGCRRLARGLAWWAPPGAPPARTCTGRCACRAHASIRCR